MIEFYAKLYRNSKKLFKVILFPIALLFLLLIVFCGFGILMMGLDNDESHTIYGNIKTDTPKSLQITVYYTYDKGLIERIGGDPSWNSYEANLPLDDTGNFDFDIDINNPELGKTIRIQQYQIHCSEASNSKNVVIYKPEEFNYTLRCLSNNSISP